MLLKLHDVGLLALHNEHQPHSEYAARRGVPCAKKQRQEKAPKELGNRRVMELNT